jgi:tetratricopeptide (TPR) repeat protein
MGDHVFISYSREDQDFVIKLANNLKSHGIPIWLDQWNNTPGVTYPQATEKALFDCTCLLVVLSPSSVKSDWVQSECHAALDEGKKVVPILYQPCRIPIRLKLIQYIDFTSISPDDEKSLEQVLRALGKGREQELSDWVKKGSDLETLGRYVDAIQAYDKAIELDSHASNGQILVWCLKGEILMNNLHKFEEALQAFDEALKIDPKSSRYWQ